MLCLLCATCTYCPVFKIKTKINVLVHSGVINRPKSTEFYIKRFLLLVHSVARTRFDDSTETRLQILGFPGPICKCCIFPLHQGNVTAEPRISIYV